MRRHKDPETKLALADLPPAVQAAGKEQSKGATLRELSKEVGGRTTLYEAELKVGDHTKDVTFDQTGKIVSVEEEVPLTTIPAAARDAIQKSAGKGKLLLVEAVTEAGKTFYKTRIRQNGKETEVKVDGDGRPMR